MSKLAKEVTHAPKNGAPGKLGNVLEHTLFGLGDLPRQTYYVPSLSFTNAIMKMALVIPNPTALWQLVSISTQDMQCLAYK